MNKPFGILSQMGSNDPKQLRHKLFLEGLFPFPEGIMPIGRLDEKSEGLLLLTTDGKISDQINRFGVQKEYWVQVDGIIGEDAIEQLREGVTIGFSGKKYRTLPCQACRIPKPKNIPTANSKLRIGRHRPTSWVSITVSEGKFRQIRKMTAAVGFPTLRLIRVRIGNIFLNSLQPGEIEPLDEDDLKALTSERKPSAF